MAVTTWNIAPDYDEWGFDTWWSCEDWIQWHGQLKKHFGQKTANDIWNYSFSKSGALSGNLDCRTLNTNFRKYVLENKLDPYANAGVLSPVLQGIGTGQDIVTGTLKGVSSFFTENKIKTILNIGMVVGVVIAGAYVYKSFKKQ
jgi:hypothetical protein